jgi:hypothetical protein
MGNQFESETADDGNDSVEWFYSGLESLIDYLGSLNTQILSNQGGEPDDSTNTARVLRDGQATDGLINMALRGGEYIVPVTKNGTPLNETADTFETRTLFCLFSNILTAYELNRHRMLFSSNPTDFDKTISDARADVIEMLAKIKVAEYQIDADQDVYDTDDPAPPGSFQSVPIIRSNCRPCDEFSQ